MSFPTTLPSYTITSGSESANGAAGGTGLSGLLNAFEVDITALGTKAGTGSSTPVANTILYGTGTGTSAWQGLTSAQMLALVSDETGTGSLVFNSSPTIVTPTIASFVNANHDHTSSAGGGTLNGATAIQSGTVESTRVNYGGAGAGIWWQEIGRTTLSGSGLTITISNFAAKRYLHVFWSLIPTAGTINPGIQFNGDTASNYASRLSSNGGADSTSLSQTSNFLDVAAAQNLFMYGSMDIINISAQEKVSIGIATTIGASGAGTAATRREQVQKWTNTASQITSLVVTTPGAAGSFATGSEVVVLGHD